MRTALADFTLHDHGSILVLHPNNEAATSWCDRHLPEDTPRWGSDPAIERRPMGEIFEDLDAAGYLIQVL